MTEASKSEEIIHINSRLIIGGQKCTIKYIGPVEGKSGTWHGVEWDNQERGKNSGLGLFKTKIEGAGSFIKISSPDGLSFTTSKKPIEVGGSFLKAVKEKYVHNQFQQELISCIDILEVLPLIKFSLDHQMVSLLKLLDGKRCNANLQNLIV